MTAREPAQPMHPTHCRASVSPDRAQLALTFSGEGHAPVTMVLPVAGAAGLQRKLAQCLLLLGARPADAANGEAARAAS